MAILNAFVREVRSSELHAFRIGIRDSMQITRTTARPPNALISLTTTSATRSDPFSGPIEWETRCWDSCGLLSVSVSLYSSIGVSMDGLNTSESHEIVYHLPSPFIPPPRSLTTTAAPRFANSSAYACGSRDDGCSVSGGSVCQATESDESREPWSRRTAVECMLCASHDACISIDNAMSVFICTCSGAHKNLVTGSK